MRIKGAAAVARPLTTTAHGPSLALALTSICCSIARTDFKDGYGKLRTKYTTLALSQNAKRSIQNWLKLAATFSRANGKKSNVRCEAKDFRPVRADEQEQMGIPFPYDSDRPQPAEKFGSRQSLSHRLSTKRRSRTSSAWLSKRGFWSAGRKIMTW